MAPKKKTLNRKEIKQPDEFVISVGRALTFLRNNKQLVSIIGGGTLAIILIVILVTWWRNYVENQARKQLDQALLVYNAVVAKNQLGTENPSGETYATEQEKYEKALVKLEELSKKYKNTQPGKLALFYMGNTLYNLGRYDNKRYDEAIDAYKHFAYEIRDDLVLVAYNGLGYAYEAKKEYTQAIEYYQKIIDYKTNYLQQDAFLNIARCYRKMEKTEQAITVYEAFLKNYPTSDKVERTQRLIDSLKSTVEGATPEAVSDEPAPFPDIEIPANKPAEGAKK